MLVQITLEILFRNEQSAAPGVLIITLTIYLHCLSFFFPFFFEGAEAAERAVSDSFRELLAQFNITSFRAASLGLGFCTPQSKTVLSKSILRGLLLSHTSNKQSHTKENGEMFLGKIKADSFIQGPVGGIDIKKHLSARCQLHISTLVDDGGSVNTNLTQAGTLFTDTADVWRCQEEAHNFLL